MILGTEEVGQENARALVGGDEGFVFVVAVVVEMLRGDDRDRTENRWRE